MVQAFNLEDTYPLFSLLKGLLEKVKHTSLNLATPKEVKNNLWVARHLAEKELADSSQRRAVMEEIGYLLGKYGKERKQINKKRKKEEQERHEGQHSEQLQELNQNKLIQGKQHPLFQQENIAQVTQQQQDAKRPRQAALKLPTPTIPLVPNVAQIRNFGCPPYVAMPGIDRYCAQPGWPGAKKYRGKTRVCYRCKEKGHLIAACAIQQSEVRSDLTGRTGWCPESPT